MAKKKSRKATQAQAQSHHHEGPLLPPWALIVIGFAAIVLGLWLTAKPFESLQALRLYAAAGLIVAGIGECTSGRPKEMPWLSVVIGAVIILAGLAVLVSPGLTVRWTAMFVGIGLFMAGLINIVTGFQTPGERVVRIGMGVVLTFIGLFSMASPDVTVKTVALLVGPATVVFGAVQIFHAFPSDAVEVAETRPSPHGR